ncbi:hypothetical protein CY34DRAFT_573228 [Suillus luteus UH-Slu-Lm8-n1]|uniref:Uncharacterized protein n=1 Tax=Suillus luteus UH-Slu-Lm8-n1 TaxID=930992 RepID=A0A0D0A4M1_9AGAM|nr:hypothetical protein CY34DRAFT_573228 [Suillus luteus UH-Slu-Lm8-n1]
MHQPECLCVPVSEILEEISLDNKRLNRLCSRLSLPDLIPSAEVRHRRSIFRLAHICRAFRGLALNVLYSHLRNFWPLILPSFTIHLNYSVHWSSLAHRFSLNHVKMTLHTHPFLHDVLKASTPLSQLTFPSMA